MNGTINKVILIGHLGDEVKMHYFENGNAIGRFPLATNEVYKNREGNKVTNTEWHNVVVHNKLAELFAKYLTKGDKVYCEGRIKTRQWTGEDGQTRYTTEIHVNDFTFLSNKKDESPSANQPSASEVKTPKPEQPPKVNTDEPEDDLPF